ncbi:hypothetical protein NDU88_004430 [Pleurodeles waltl]|uniref:Uncharacterized protein n=1 Tax=Pleurodeles waltl TaxID=8319 RepID=A0AAV7T7D2_PLEWA|nr:hypothetical protein NDU88_004430 [Pleurodeles waltl]
MRRCGTGERRSVSVRSYGRQGQDFVHLLACLAVVGLRRCPRPWVAPGTQGTGLSSGERGTSRKRAAAAVGLEVRRSPACVWCSVRLVDRRRG